MVEPAVRAAALLAGEGAPGDRLGDLDEVPDLEHEVPARVEGASAGGAQVLRALPDVVDLPDRGLEVVLRPEDPDERLHDRLELLAEPVRVRAAGAGQRRLELLFGRPDLGRVD